MPGKLKAFVLAAAVLPILFQLHVAECADKTPEKLRDEAISDVNVAMRLYKQAQDILQSDVTKESMKASLGLYVQAGQLFEKSENIFRKLGTKYVPQDNVVKCTNLKNECLTAINNLKKAISG